MTNESMKKVAVIGCGYWGRNLVRNLNELEALALVCDASSAGRALAREIAPNAAVVRSIEDVLSTEIDSVAIATPAETHFELTRQALEANRDVFVEKPLALKYEEGYQLVQLAEARNRILMVGHVMEYHPAVACLQSLVRRGELGKIHYVYSNRLSLGKVRREENILWSFAPHDIAILLRLTGSLPLQVAACGNSYVQPNVADITLTNLLFDHGVRAHIYVSWLHPFKEQRLVVIGSRKMASFDDVAKRLVLYDQRVEVREGQPIPVRGDGIDLDFNRNEPLRVECEAFLHAIATRRPPLTDGLSGLRVLKVLEAAQRSLMMNGEPMTLQMETASLDQYVSV